MRKLQEALLGIGRGWVAAAALVALLAGVGQSFGDDGSRAEAVVTGVVVDEVGRPVVDAEVDAVSWPDAKHAASDAAGAFRFTLPSAEGRVYALLIARYAGRIGVLDLSGRQVDSAVPLRIVLKTGRPLEVRAVDRQGHAVEGADVYFLMGMLQVAAGRTDGEGRWTTTVPTHSRGWSLYALKPKTGFDYAEAERGRGSAEPPNPLPEHLTLTLDGARPPLRVKAVDLQGKPLPNVRLGPWLLQKPGRETQMNGMSSAFRKTDDDGVVVLDWLPERLEGQISIVGSAQDYYIPDHAVWLPADKPLDETTVTLRLFERLAGRVTTPDGRPAADALVTASGRGADRNVFNGTTRTDGDGRYTFNRVYSDYAYILTAAKNGMVSPFRSDAIVRAGKPAEGVDLVLGPGTRLKGRVTVGKDQPPTEPMYVSAVFSQAKFPEELIPKGSQRAYSLSMQRHAEVDKDGNYDLLLGPGEYRLQGPPRVEPVKLVIPAAAPPAEIVQDFEMPRPNSGKLTVTVVDGDEKPVGAAVLDGVYQAMSGYFSPIRTNDRGMVQLVHSLDPLVLSASTPDRSQAAVVRLDAEATEIRIVLKPTATASGRLVDPEGKSIAGRELTYGVRVNLSTKRNGPFTHRFGGHTTTDSDGGFRLPGLVVGEKYEIQTEDGNRYVSAKTKPLADSPGPLALGDVLLDLTPSKPYVPTTPAQRTAEAFAARKEKSSSEKLEYVLTEAKREYTRPLLLFGKADDPACVDLFRLFNEPGTNDAEAKDKPRPKTPADLRWDFDLSSLDASPADVKSFARDLGATVGEGMPPVLVLLSDEGKPVASYPLALGADKKLDAPALAAFMLQHKLPTRDAEAVLAEGLAKAKAEDKRVFLDFGASWCGPCRMLGRFLEANKAELERHYVFVKLDVSRDDHARPLCERYEEKDAINGVPWYVILDGDGKPLITSNAKDLGEDAFSTNIGFPSSKPGIDHFMTMLKQTAPRMSDVTLAGLRRQLEKKP